MARCCIIYCVTKWKLLWLLLLRHFVQTHSNSSKAKGNAKIDTTFNLSLDFLLRCRERQAVSFSCRLDFTSVRFKTGSKLMITIQRHCFSVTKKNTSFVCHNNFLAAMTFDAFGFICVNWFHPTWTWNFKQTWFKWWRWWFLKGSLITSIILEVKQSGLKCTVADANWCLLKAFN